MTHRSLWFAGLAVVLVTVAAPQAPADQANGNAEDKAAIQKAAEAYANAFQQGDAKAVAAFWTQDGDYTTPKGLHLRGREAIEKALQAFFQENKGLKLGITTESLRFVTPMVAIEDGISDVFPPDGGPPSRARYSIVHVKTEGKWLLGSVKTTPYIPPTNYQNLRDLEWLIGDWADEVDGVVVGKASFSWSENQGFIVGGFSTMSKGVILTGGTQWIGWDPLAKRIRSWTFDFNGGFGESAWTRENGTWEVKSNLIFQDGRKLAATNVIKQVDAETLTWQSRDRTMDGKPLPDVKEIRMKRLK
jgi:uncharacterized protein (TIGR02246 family)